MFGHAHYLPVMRAKKAELEALRQLAPSIRSRTTPILECPSSVLKGCQSSTELEAKLDDIVSHLEGWSRRTLFLDFRMVSRPGRHPLDIISDRCKKADIRPVPVATFKVAEDSDYDRAIRTVLQRYGTAICLRVSSEELRSRSIASVFDTWLTRYGVTAAQVDLVIDRGGVDSASLTYPEFVQGLPLVDSWRSLTVLAGSFPENLEGLAPRQTHRLRRFEWRQWRALDTWEGRRPAFGDYTVQHVVIKEPVPAPNFSASIRYTLEDEFLVLRGEGVRNDGSPGYAQFNAWATLLRDGPEFFGATFSQGDRYIADRAADWRNTGDARTWLQAAFSHHVTTTALQVANQLERARRVTASGADWTAISDFDQPGATL